MEEFPRNSRKNVTAPANEDAKVDKKIDPVVTGEVVRRKQPLGRRFVNVFIKGDARRAWGDVIADVLVPAAKDMVTDAVQQGLERMIYGETRSRPGRRGGSSYGGVPTRINYTSYSSPVGRASGLSQRRDEDRTPMSSRRSRANHDFDEIVLKTRVEAEEVIDRMFDLVSRYEVVTVSDLYELVGITGEYTDEKWGWTDIRGANVSRVREGYLLDLPKPGPLD